MNGDRLRMHRPTSEPAPPGWIVTYADMVTLLLCLFVGLLSMSAIKPELFQNALGSLQGAFGSKKAAAGSDGSQDNLYSRARRELAAWMEPDDRAQADEELKWVSLLPTSRGLTLRLSGAEAFARLESDLGMDAKELLLRLAEVLASGDIRVDIAGYCVDEASDPGQERELSFQRAASVARTLEKGGVPARAIRVTALADAEPLSPHAYTRGRKEMNRGVVIQIEKADFEDTGGF